MRRFWKTLVLLAVGVAVPLAAEEPAYVSRIATQANGQSVLITWKDAPGYSGAKYEIFRADKEILKDTLSKAKLLATVDSGVEAYEDKTVTGPSFYLVLLKDKSGSEKKYFIPFKNKTTAAVQPTGEPPAPTAQVKVGTLTYANPKIKVAFEASPADKKLLVFRRTSPIRSATDLKDSTLLGSTTGAASPFSDTPPPGLQFYYAVVDAQAYADGRPDVFLAANASDQAVGFPLVQLPKDVVDTTPDPALRPKIADTARALPIPLIQLQAEPDSGAPLVPAAYTPIEPKPLPEAAQTTLRNLAKSPPVSTSFPALWIFPEERSGAQEGAAKYLAEIQKAYLQPQDWKGAVGALTDVLKLTLTPKTEARARFYLGESLGSLKDYRRAFLEFLAASEVYPEETAPFLEALFTLLASETS